MIAAYATLLVAYTRRCDLIEMVAGGVTHW